MHTTQIKPLYDKVLVQRSDPSALSAGGLHLPQAAADKPAKGLVMAVGTGRLLEDGTLQPLTVQVGDVVLFGKYQGTEIEIPGEDGFLIFREEDILAVIEGGE